MFEEHNQSNNLLHSFVCNYGVDVKEEMIRDRVVFGKSSQRVRENLITEGETLTLDKAIQIVQSHEYPQEQFKTMSTQQNTAAVHQVNHHAPRSSNWSKVGQHRKPNHTRTPKESRDHGRFSKKQTQTNKETECDKCGYIHIKSTKCPAQGQQCSICKKWNLFAKKCRSKRVNEIVMPAAEQSDTAFYNRIKSKKLSGILYIIARPNTCKV